MGNYVLDLGSFAFENQWQVGLAASAVLLYVLYGVIPSVCLTYKFLFNSYADYSEGIVASAALIPIFGTIVGIIFWEENKTMTAIGGILTCSLVACFLGCILCSVEII